VPDSKKSLVLYPNCLTLLEPSDRKGEGEGVH